MNFAQKIKNLDTADVVTLGVGLALVLSDVFLTNKVRVGVATEDGGNCPPGFVYDGTTYTCNPISAKSCPTGYTFANGTCNLNTATVASTPAYNTNMSYYDTGSTVLKGLNTGINSLVSSLENASGFYTNSSSVLQACQDVAQRVNDYFPNNSLVPQFVTAYKTAYNNGTIGSVYQQALSGAYNDIQFINNFIQLVNSGVVSSSDTSTASTTTNTASNTNTADSSGLSFSGTISSVSNNMAWLTGSGDSIFAGGTSKGYGMPYWSGEITYSSGAFSGSLTLNGTPVIVGQGNSIVGIGSTASVNGIAGSYSGTITYSGGAFSGTIYVSVSGGSPTPVLSGKGLYLMGNAGANSTGFAGAIQATAGTGNVAATLTSAITKLTALVTQTVQAGAFASFSNWSNSSSGQHTSAAASVSYSNGAIVIAAAEDSNYGGCGGSWNGNATVQVGNNNLIVSTSGMLSSSGSIGINENGFTGGSISINDTGVPNCARRNISFNFSVVSPLVLNINVGGGTSGGNLAGQIQVALSTTTTNVCPSGYTDVNGNCLS